MFFMNPGCLSDRIDTGSFGKAGRNIKAQNAVIGQDSKNPTPKLDTEPKYKVDIDRLQTNSLF